MEHHFGFPLETIVIFFSLVLFFVWIDLRQHRSGKEITMGNAIGWSVFWVVLALGFYSYLRVRFGTEYASLFLSGYVLEKSLSIDNLMVFMAIFASFGIKPALQHRILYFGILGAIIFRMIFIALGTGVFALSTWVEFIFAAIVAWTGWKMLSGVGDDNEITDYSDHWSVRLTRKILPIYPRLYQNHFLIPHALYQEQKLQDDHPAVTWEAARYATPMLLCLVCIEVSDIIFSFDSVPAVIAVTREPLLVYTSVIFAILGLRSMYFVLVVAAKYLCHLEKAVAVLLFFIAGKLALQASNNIFHWPDFHLSPNTSLAIILSVLALGVVASLVLPEKAPVATDEESTL